VIVSCKYSTLVPLNGISQYCIYTNSFNPKILSSKVSKDLESQIIWTVIILSWFFYFTELLGFDRASLLSVTFYGREILLNFSFCVWLTNRFDIQQKWGTSSTPDLNITTVSRNCGVTKPLMKLKDSLPAAHFLFLLPFNKRHCECDVVRVYGRNSWDKWKKTMFIGSDI